MLFVAPATWNGQRRATNGPRTMSLMSEPTLPPHQPPPDRRPLLIAADWQSRALLLAELQERGVEVRTEAGVKWALHALLGEPLTPPLVFLDSRADSDATPEKVARLLRLLGEGGTPPRLILLVGTFERSLWAEAFGKSATILTRPKTVGEVAGVVQTTLNDPP